MKNKINQMIVIFLVPVLVAYSVVFLYPTIRTILMSFFKTTFITQPIDQWEFIGFGNYITIFNDPLYIRSLTNVGAIWLFGGIITMVFALFFAVVICSGIKWKSFFRAVIYLPNTISAIALGTMWMQYIYSSKYGLLKSFFEILGMEKLASFPWTSPENIFGSMVIAYSFGCVGYHMLVFIAGIDAIPAELNEAATVDGANAIRRFCSITLPLLRNTFKTNIILWTVGCSGFFMWTKIFSPLTSDRETITPMVYMYDKSFANLDVTTTIDVGIGAAVSVVLSLMVLLAFVINNKIIKDRD